MILNRTIPIVSETVLSKWGPPVLALTEKNTFDLLEKLTSFLLRFLAEQIQNRSQFCWPLKDIFLFIFKKILLIVHNIRDFSDDVNCVSLGKYIM